MKSRVLTVVLVGLVVVLMVPGEALAATTNFGKNLGDQARGLAVALFLAVAGLVSLPVLGRRDVNGGVVLAMLVLVLGGFVFAQDSVKTVIVSLWRSLVGA